VHVADTCGFRSRRTEKVSCRLNHVRLREAASDPVTHSRWLLYGGTKLGGDRTLSDESHHPVSELRRGVGGSESSKPPSLAKLVTATR